MKQIKNVEDYALLLPQEIAKQVESTFDYSTFEMTEKEWDSIRDIARDATASFQPPTIQEHTTVNNQIIIKTKPAFNITTQMRINAASKAETLACAAIRKNLNKAFASKFTSPDKDTYDALIDRLFFLQTEDERRTLKLFFWQVARKIKGLRVPRPIMLILYGSQGLGKSFIIEEFAKTLGKNQHCNTSVDELIDSNFTPLPIKQGSPIIIFDELGTLEKKNLNKLKAIITSSEFVVQEKYEKDLHVPNTFSFCLTTNDDPSLLMQDVGDRRYPVVEYKSTYSVLSIEEIREMISQIWETVPYTLDDPYDSKDFADRLIEKTAAEKTDDILTRLLYEESNGGGSVFASMINTLTDKPQRKAYFYSRSGKISKNQWKKILDESRYFEKISPTSKFYKIKDLQALQDLMNGVERPDTEEKEPSVEDKLRAEIARLKSELAKNNGPDDDPNPPEGPQSPEDFEYDPMEWKMPCKDSTYSTPSFTDVGQFVVTGRYSDAFMESYMAGNIDKLNAQGANMIPTAFVFESDDLPKEEQLSLAATVRQKYGNNIIWQVDSGSKSVHTLIKIDPEDGEAIKKHGIMKECWTCVAREIFGSAEHLDPACASIARLSRTPNAIRDNGNKQTCLYLNKNAEGYPLKSIIRNVVQTKVIEATMRAEYLASIQGKENPFLHTHTEEQSLENFYNSRPEKWSLAYDTLILGGIPESGSNMLGAISSLKQAGLENLARQMYDICKQAHPSNIRKRYEDISIRNMSWKN